MESPSLRNGDHEAEPMDIDKKLEDEEMMQTDI